MSFKQLCEGGRNGHMNSRKLNVSRRFCFCCFSIRLFGKSCFSGKNLPITQCLNFSQERFYKVILLRFWFSNTVAGKNCGSHTHKRTYFEKTWWFLILWYFYFPILYLIFYNSFFDICVLKNVRFKNCDFGPFSGKEWRSNAVWRKKADLWPNYF